MTSCGMLPGVWAHRIGYNEYFLTCFDLGSLCSFLVKTNTSGVDSECMISDDSNVVEVGAGTGAVGLVAASLGASVMLTDR